MIIRIAKRFIPEVTTLVMASIRLCVAGACYLLGLKVFAHVALFMTFMALAAHAEKTFAQHVVALSRRLWG